MEPRINVLFDIETVATDKSREYVEGKVYDLPKNLLPSSEMPAAIAKIKDDGVREHRFKQWQEERREKIKRYVQLKQMDDIEKAALHWWQSKIISIAWCFVHDETGEIVGEGVKCNDKESVVLRAFFDKTMNCPYRVARLLGKNSKNFDIPFLIGRALALDLGIPDFLRARISTLGDIDEIFGSLSAKNNQITSLSNYAFGLDIAGKTAVGSSVQSMYRAGELNRIKDYNREDVRIVAEMHRRWLREYE